MSQVPVVGLAEFICSADIWPLGAGVPVHAAVGGSDVDDHWILLNYGRWPIS